MLHSLVERVEEVPAFAGNQVFRVQAGDRVFFLKQAVDPEAFPSIASEVTVLTTLDSLRIPVPRIEAHDLAGELTGYPCMLLVDIGGEPLEGEGTESTFRQAGAVLRVVHDVAADGFGAVNPPPPLRGEDDAWAQAIGRQTGGLQPIVDAGLLSGDLVIRAQRAVEVRADLLSEVTVGRLIHGDFSPRHVFADSGRLTGIIDWGDAMVGDPLYDLGRIVHSVLGRLNPGTLADGFALLALFLETYGDAPWLYPDPTEKVLLYAAAFVMWSMQGEFSAGAPWLPWWDYQAAALSQVLDALDAK